MIHPVIYVREEKYYRLENLSDCSNGAFKTMENGNLDITVSVGGNREFEQLSKGINTMIKSIVNTSDRISKIIEMSDVSLATLEHQAGMKQVFVTSGLAELLNFPPNETKELYKDPALFYNQIEKIMESPIDGETDVYKTGKDKYVRIHLSKDDENYLGVVTDVSSEIMDKQREKAISLLRSFWKKLSQNPIKLPNGQKQLICISGGFAIAEESGNDITKLLQHADDALYQAKKAGKNCIAEYFEGKISS